MKSISIGVAAHISAAAPGGPRYDVNLTSASRAGIENGIWLCHSCSDHIDKDPGRYTQRKLLRWKEKAEAVAFAEMTSNGSRTKRSFAEWIIELVRENQSDSDGSFSKVRGEDDGFRHSYLASLARENIAVLIERLTEHFFGRKNDLDRIDRFVAERVEGAKRGLMVVTAPAGFGKSALAAQWCKRQMASARYEVVRHFCSTSARDATATASSIQAHLFQEIARAYGSSELSVPKILSKNLPSGKPLVIWLDGIDEVGEDVDCFLPQKLGDRVCVIVSARADANIVPSYLAPWLTDGMAVSHRPLRHHMDNLSFEDVKELVEGLFGASAAAVPAGLPKYIFRASNNGHALFARYMTESALQDRLAGNALDFTRAPQSLEEYSRSELGHLRRLKAEWPAYGPLFAFLTAVQEAVSTDELPALIGRQVFPASLPNQISRWFSVIEKTEQQPPLLGFAHAKLAELFGEALGSDRGQVIRELCDRFRYEGRDLESYSSWPTYALRHLPTHLIDSGRISDLFSYLTDERFIEARFQVLGDDAGPVAMAADWMKWFYSYSRAKTEPSKRVRSNILLAKRHLRFWSNFAPELKILARQGAPSVWRQLMHDVGLGGMPSSGGLVLPQPHLLPNSLAPLVGHSAVINGAIALSDRSGFLSWSEDNTLRLWGPAGEQRTVLDGHKEAVNGALALKDGTGFLSWSDDKSLRLWGKMGETGPMLCGHRGAVNGALAVRAATGFLSWSDDRTLRLWGMNGERRPAFRGHKKSVEGALELRNGKGFLSWSKDKTLRLWSVRGKEEWELTGHDNGVLGALEFKGRAGFLSWSDDNTLRVWGSDGRKGAVLTGHTKRIKGALETSDGKSCLSWSRDGNLMLWSLDGEKKQELQGHEGPVLGAIELRHGMGFLSWSDDRTLRLWGTQGESGPELIGHRGGVLGALELLDGSGFVSWSEDGSLIIWKRDGSREPAMLGHDDAVVGAVELNDGAGFLSWSWDKTLRLWGIADEEKRPVPGHHQRVTGSLVLNGGSNFVTWSERQLRFWEPSNEDGVKLGSHGAWISGVLERRDGAGFVSWGQDANLRLWGKNGEAGPYLIGHKKNVVGVLERTDCEGFLSWSNDETLRLWGPNGEVVRELQGHLGRVNGVLPLRNGLGFLSWSDDRTLRKWLNNGEMGPVFTGHKSWVAGALELGSDGGFLSWDWEGSLRLWSANGDAGVSMTDHKYAVKNVWLLDEDRGFLSWSDDGSVKLWHRSGQLEKTIRDHGFGFKGVLMLKGGAGFVSWGWDETLKFWSSTGEEIKTLSGHRSWLNGAISLEGDAGILSWGQEGTLRVWNRNGHLSNMWVSPDGPVLDVKPAGGPDRYLVTFASHVGVVYLPLMQS